MPVVRFSRDKRGYEYIYLVHTPTRRGKPGRTRVLYWYRTPPGVRIGRKPFDEDVQRMLEQQNPGVTFDWPAIVKAEMPPPDMTEFWRERRRAEKAARQERRAAEAEDTPETDQPEAPVGVVEPKALPAELNIADSQAPETVAAGSEPATTAEGAEAAAGGTSKKRRRRRGGRRRKGAAASADSPDAGDAGADGGPRDDAGPDDGGADTDETEPSE